MEYSHYLILVSVLLPAWLLLYYPLPYYTTYSPLRHIPGPFLAKFSNLWLAYHSRHSQRYLAIHSAHQRHGTLVRIGYNHISIASERAINVVYAHGNGFLKADFYDAFVSGVPGVFSTRDRAQHARKRKLVAHAFSAKKVVEFEGSMAENLENWVKKLDEIAGKGENDGYAKVDLMPWCTYIAFDVIGALVFGTPFGMVEKGKDECETQLPDGSVVLTRGAETLNRRGEVSSTLGWLPLLQPFAACIPDPFFSKGLASVQNLHGIAAKAISDRLAEVEKQEDKHHDILALLLKTKDPDGFPMQPDELTSEALTQLIAGSDTVSNTSCAIIYWILAGERNKPGTILPRLHRELDSAIPSSTAIATYMKE
ncbi:cytochrome p450 benzoate 4-monooxygenase [Aureobasidium sp. EXF-10727]|nr:cytochrome p450 benzoate 4-monooxygenase [Aureobasidium sp. EXF-10727]